MDISRCYLYPCREAQPCRYGTSSAYVASFNMNPTVRLIILQKTSDPAHSTCPLPVEETPSETPNPDLAYKRTTLAILQTPVPDSNLAAPTSVCELPPNHQCNRSFTRYCFPDNKTHGRQRHDQVSVQAPSKSLSAADIVHLGRACLHGLCSSLPDTAEASGAQPSSTPSANEPATHNSASVMPSLYDGNLLRRICPADLMGVSCEHEGLFRCELRSAVGL